MKNVKRIKTRKITNKMKKKLLVVFFVVLAALVFLSGRLIKLNITKGYDYSKAVYNNFNYTSSTLAAKRGNITDRNGTVLAYSTKVYNLIIDAAVILSDETYRQPVTDALVQEFGIDVGELNEYLDENAQRDNADRDRYKRLLLELTDDEIDSMKKRISEKNSLVKGVWFEDSYKRFYPYNTLACDLLGFSSDANGGEIGIEKYYNSYLEGTNGRTYGYIDDSSYDSVTKSPINGNNVVSTIDYTIQEIVENEIVKFNEEYGSKSTSVLVMDPNNAEILAMANYPSFDLNNPRDISAIYSEEDIQQMVDDAIKELPEDEASSMTAEEYDELRNEVTVSAMYSVWSNYCVSTVFEPGSTFKTFTVAEALEENLVTLEDEYTCDGYGVYDNTKILCHGGDGHGDLTLAGTLDESCNDALMQIGMQIGKHTFSRYLDVFELCQKTGIDLPSEENGLHRPEEGMMDVDLVTNSFGQNLNVTMVQMAATYASIINGGKYYRPHVVKEIRNDNGDLIKSVEPLLVTETVSEKTSKTMREILRTVVDYGTGGFAAIDGYSIGGKTGTAEKAGRDKTEYVVSFLGFAPAEDPKVMIYVVIDAPQVEMYDSSWAAQIVEKAIMEKILPYMEIERNNPDYTEEIPIRAGSHEIAVKRPFDASTVTQTPIVDDTTVTGDGTTEGETPAEEAGTPEGETPAEEAGTPEGEAPAEEAGTPEGEAPAEEAGTPEGEAPAEEGAAEGAPQTPDEGAPAEGE